MHATDLFDDNSKGLSKPSTLKLVEEIKAAGEDFEFYPTTDEIIDCVKTNLDSIGYGYPSILDCGAGDGRVLNALSPEGQKYAIEKSTPLLQALDKNIFVVGTDFNQQTLIDKKVSVVYSNPPYSVFEEWAIKIIAEANAEYIYLVIPSRWSQSKRIQESIENRDADASVIGSFDFLDADRVARATVDVVRIQLCYNYSRHGNSGQRTDPFKLWFDENFKGQVVDGKLEPSEKLSDKVENALVQGDNLIPVLEKLYLRDMDELIQTYQALTSMNPAILKELNVSVAQARGGLKLKIEGLKSLYWQELFAGLKQITDRLTASSRKTLLDTLTENTQIDFTASNCYAVVIWVIKHANAYFDSQLINTMEKMTQKANVQLYKSNQNTFGLDNWKYIYDKPRDLERYKLDYRIVVDDQFGGFQPEGNGKLKNSSANMVDDLRAVASTIGFDTLNQVDSSSFKWYSGERKEFLFHNHATGETEVLFEVRAYKKGTMHFKMNKAFICKLNVEFGRLKGWIKSPKEAVDEMDISLNMAAEAFGSSIKLEGSSVAKLGFSV